MDQIKKINQMVIKENINFYFHKYKKKHPYTIIKIIVEYILS